MTPSTLTHLTCMCPVDNMKQLVDFQIAGFMKHCSTNITTMRAIVGVVFVVFVVVVVIGVVGGYVKEFVGFEVVRLFKRCATNLSVE